MSALGAVYRRELAGYFGQPVAYIVLTAYLLICGWFFVSGLFLVGQADVRGYLDVAPTILLFFAPALTMRLLAEEWKNGTMELLLTLPVRDLDVVLGKYLAAFTVLVAAQALTLAYPLTVGLLGDVDLGAVATGYLGLLLVGGAFLAVGLLASALTASQVVAFIVAFFVCFGLYLLGKALAFLPPELVPVLDYLAIDGHFANLTKGVVDSRDLLYFGSVVLLCLAATVHALKGRKWGR